MDVGANLEEWYHSLSCRTLSRGPANRYHRPIRTLGKRALLRLSAVLFVLAAIAFAFTPVHWMAVVEGCVALFLFAVSFRVDRLPPR